MVVIGLCGSSGSGKSTVAGVWKAMGAVVADCDMIYAELTSGNPDGNPSECTAAVSRAFGGGMISSDGSLDRAAVRRLIFADDEKRKKLNEITHAAVLNEVVNTINKARDEGNDTFVVDAPLLFESGFDKKCDVTVCVVSPLPLKIKRIILRDCLTEDQAEMRLSKQLSDSELEKLCDITIINDSGIDVLKKRAAGIYKGITDNELKK
ncbi:MAG: dephospho-CoA kinase [Oscillospiraceae bacterium]|nr:dephospho-CoA kinase [Oscillospiraceae bacterium]